MGSRWARSSPSTPCSAWRRSPLMEIVLGIDNVVFIAILVAKLPAAQQELARRLGLTLALGIRILLLLTISWIMGLTEAARDRARGERDLGARASSCWAAASSCIVQGDRGRSTRRSRGTPTSAEGGKARAAFGWVLLQILAARHRVLARLGDHRGRAWRTRSSVMITAMVLAMLVMLVSAGAVSDFVERHPSIKILALSFLLLIGVMLVAEGMGTHMAKGYVYFAMAFSLLVEMLNMRYRRRRRPPPRARLTHAIGRPHRPRHRRRARDRPGHRAAAGRRRAPGRPPRPRPRPGRGGGARRGRGRRRPGRGRHPERGGGRRRADAPWSAGAGSTCS